MKFGIDVHGVADTKKKFFAVFTQRAIANGHEVHIITGSQKTPELEKELYEFGIRYTAFFSIADRLLAEGREVFWKDKNNPYFKKEIWEDAKGKYCAEQAIDIHFDDSRDYQKHFTTLYVRVV